MSDAVDFVCKISIKPIEEWVGEKPTDGSCPPCMIAPLASYYLGTLQKAGETTLASELEATYESGDILTISRKLDNIKGDVGEALKQELRNLDCFAQSFKPDAAGN